MKKEMIKTTVVYLLLGMMFLTGSAAAQPDLRPKVIGGIFAPLDAPPIIVPPMEFKDLKFYVENRVGMVSVPAAASVTEIVFLGSVSPVRKLCIPPGVRPVTAPIPRCAPVELSFTINTSSIPAGGSVDLTLEVQKMVDALDPNVKLACPGTDCEIIMIADLTKKAGQASAGLANDRLVH